MHLLTFMEMRQPGGPPALACIARMTCAYRMSGDLTNCCAQHMCKPACDALCCAIDCRTHKVLYRLHGSVSQPCTCIALQDCHGCH
jgi:hypothetical protein